MPQHMLMPVSTSAYTHWTDATSNEVPGHITPGAFFPAYNGYSLVEAIDMDIAWGFGSHPPLVDADQTMRGVSDGCFHDPLSCLPAPSTFNTTSTIDDAMSYRFSGLSTVSDLHSLLASCDSFMQNSTVTLPTPSYTPGFYSRSVGLKNRHESACRPSESTHRCQWLVNGIPCNTSYPAEDNLKHAISRHLSTIHSVSPAAGNATQKCHWLGCGKVLKPESIVRHIATVHLHVTTACKVCGTTFARPDSLQRHMKKSCGAGKVER